MKNDDFMEELFRESESLRAEKSFKLENVLKALKKEERLQGYEILQEPFTQTGGHALVFSLQEKNKLGKVGVLKVAAKSHWDKLRHEKQILETLLGKKCFIQLEKFYEEIPFLGSTLHALFLKPYCPSNLRREYQSPDKKDLKIFLRWILEIARALEVFHSKEASISIEILNQRIFS